MSLTVTFFSGETVGATQTINVNITNDQSVEDDEFFRVNITSADPVMFEISSAEVTIQEDSTDGMSTQCCSVLVFSSFHT